METVKIATNKQIAYLEGLNAQISVLKTRYPQLTKFVTFGVVNWKNEQRNGMTTADASAKIDAMRTIISNVNVLKKMQNIN